MAQRKKKFTKKKKHTARRELEADSDGDFELVTEVRNDDSVRKILTNNVVGNINTSTTTVIVLPVRQSYWLVLVCLATGGFRKGV